MVVANKTSFAKGVSKVGLPNGLKIGTVKFFGKEDKYGGLFGFLFYLDEDGHQYEVFFHKDAGRRFKTGTDWYGKASPEFADKQEDRKPEKGDRLIFHLDYASFSAEVWGFDDEFMKIKRQINWRLATASHLNA